MNRRATVGTGCFLGFTLALTACSNGSGVHTAPEPKAEAPAIPAGKIETYADHKQKILDAFSKQDYRAAAAEAETAIGADPTIKEAYLLLSKAWIEARNENEALLAFTDLARRFPDRPEPWFFLGFHHGRVKHWATAKEALEKAVALAPEDSEAHYRLGLVIAESDGSKASLPELRRAVELDPNSAGKVSSLMVALQEAGEGDAANAIASKLLAGNPGSAEAHYAVARLRMTQKKFGETEAELRKTLAIAPDFTYAKADLDQLLVQLGKKKPAEASASVPAPASTSK